MRLLVFMRDGRTVYALRGRGELARLAGVEPWGEHKSLPVLRGHWNHGAGGYDWAPVRVRFIAKGSISHVEEDNHKAAEEREAAFAEPEPVPA